MLPPVAFIRAPLGLASFVDCHGSHIHVSSDWLSTQSATMHRVRTTSQTLRCEAYRMQSQPTSTHPYPDPSSECLVGACSYNRRHAGLPTPTPKESDPRHSHVAELTKPSPTSIRTACLPPPHLHSPVCPIKSRPALVGTDTASLPPKEAIRHRALPEAQGGDRRSQVLDTEKTSASKGQCVCAEPQTSMAACSRPREGSHLGGAYQELLAAPDRRASCRRSQGGHER